MSRSGDRGVFPSQMIAEAIKQGWIASGEGELPAQSIQPASLDLRLGDVAYRLRCSFLPDDEPVESLLRRYEMGRIDLAAAGGILEQNRPYLVPLVERLDLPPDVSAKAIPRRWTRRVDSFSGVSPDHFFLFYEVRRGVRERLYLAIVPQT